MIPVQEVFAMSLRYRMFAVLMLTTSLFAAEETHEEEYFVYDPAAHAAEAAIAENPEFYEIDIASAGDTVWATWLEFVPGRGDVIWLGRIDGDDITDRTRIVGKPGRYARPLVTVAAKDKLYVTCEAEIDGQWDILARTVDIPSRTVGDAIRISPGQGSDINHRTAMGPDNQLWIVWQTAVNGKFQIVTRWIDGDQLGSVENVSGEHTGSAWAPDIVWTRDERMVVCWDACDATGFRPSNPKVQQDGDFDLLLLERTPASYNIYTRIRAMGKWQPPLAITKSDAYKAQPRLVAGESDIYLAWEEGGKNWGGTYTSRMLLRRSDQLDVTDDHGPLHRFRKLHVIKLLGGKLPFLSATPLPMPSWEAAEKREGLPEGVEHIGVYYERPVLTVDNGGRLWVFYRHRYGKYLGTSKKSHVESDWAVDARYADGDGWSDLYRVSLGQGDGMQSLALAPVNDGIMAAFTTGRTDRREQDRPRGVAWATLTPDEAAAATEFDQTHDQLIQDWHGQPRMRRNNSRESEEKPAYKEMRHPAHTHQVAGKDYLLFFGDLHRHTDLSLCYVPYDGTLDEAYRYGSDVAGYDFLGITDHSRDIAQGNADSQLWWRSVKEVMRHDLSPWFIPLYAYERSRGGEDHNVISLRADMLRPFTYPHPEFWKELDNDTLTIPHQTMTQPWPEGEPQPRGLVADTWNERDDAHRPLIEIYQGCRHRAIEDNANEGLLREHLLGFIASSDHLSTSHSYACVWAGKPERETIFRAMQQRRTYGATAKIILAVTAGEHWMGEKFETTDLPELSITATGTDTIVTLDLIVDGQTVESLQANEPKLDLTLDLPALEPGLHYAYVRLEQTDGHRAWSSPIFFDLKPKGHARR